MGYESIAKNTNLLKSVDLSSASTSTAQAQKTQIKMQLPQLIAGNDNSKIKPQVTEGDKPNTQNTGSDKSGDKIGGAVVKKDLGHVPMANIKAAENMKTQNLNRQVKTQQIQQDMPAKDPVAATIVLTSGSVFSKGSAKTNQKNNTENTSNYAQLAQEVEEDDGVLNILMGKS